jgi:hypothetical protein
MTTMFKLVKERTAWWPVTWLIPCEDLLDGKPQSEEVRVELQFRLLGDEEVRALEAYGNQLDKELLAKIEAKQTAPTQKQIVGQIMFKFVTGWRGVGDEKGVVLPFTLETLSDFANLPGSQVAIQNAFSACRAGEAELRSKN